jgi:uncharacterized protein YneF (UPF0154 family)
MHARKRTRSAILAVAIISLFVSTAAPAADETPLTKEQIRQFLLNAKVVGSKPSKKGVTNTSRLTTSINQR